MNGDTETSEHEGGCKEGEETLDNEMQDMNDEIKVSEQVLLTFVENHGKRYRILIFSFRQTH